MSKIMGIEISEDEELMAEDMGLGEYIEQDFEDKTSEITKRLEYIRRQIKLECISYGEIAELQSLSKHIDKGDVELLEWAGVKEK